jgi:hypothetical protein
LRRRWFTADNSGAEVAAEVIVIVHQSAPGRRREILRFVGGGGGRLHGFRLDNIRLAEQIGIVQIDRCAGQSRRGQVDPEQTFGCGGEVVVLGIWI